MVCHPSWHACQTRGVSGIISSMTTACHESNASFLACFLNKRSIRHNFINDSSLPWIQQSTHQNPQKSIPSIIYSPLHYPSTSSHTYPYTPPKLLSIPHQSHQSLTPSSQTLLLLNIDDESKVPRWRVIYSGRLALMSLCLVVRCLEAVGGVGLFCGAGICY